jgi:hypothetical protein
LTIRQADEQDFGGVDLQELLLRVLSSALGWDIRNRPFKYLQQSLLDALAPDIAGYTLVLALPGQMA